MSLSADRDTTGDFARVMDLLTLRPIQFCLFLKALVGKEEMLKMMVQAVGVAKRGCALLHPCPLSFAMPLCLSNSESAPGTYRRVLW